MANVALHVAYTGVRCAEVGTEVIRLIWFSPADCVANGDGNGEKRPNELTRTTTSSRELLEVFRAFDREGTGCIDASDLQSAMKKIGYVLASTEVCSMLRQVDQSGDGTVDFDEFQTFFSLLPDRSLDVICSRWVHLAAVGGVAAPLRKPVTAGGPSAAASSVDAAVGATGKRRRSEPHRSPVAETKGRHIHTQSDEQLQVFEPVPAHYHLNAVYGRFDGSLWGSVGAPSSDDLRQGDLCNCYLVAALGVLADQFEDAIRDAIRPCSPPENGEPRLYEVSFQLPARKSRRASSNSSGGRISGAAATGIYSVQVVNRVIAVSLILVGIVVIRSRYSCRAHPC